MRRLISCMILTSGLFVQFFAQTGTGLPTSPSDYYESAYKLSGTALRAALHTIVKNHTVVSYSSLWTHFQTTDKKPNGKVWDIYSDIPGGTPPYEFTFVSNQCGNYNGEADCYNREHSWPSSWFNDVSPPYSDLFHLYPTDGYVNNRRSNYPFGKVNAPTWTSLNGSKLGPNTSPGYTGTVFEPIDAYKGDLARSAFYMSVRYYTEDASWSTSAGTNKSELLAWYASLLFSWHEKDTVSQKEINRNEAIYGIQKNRNPFVDHPEFAAEIWSTSAGPKIVSIVGMTTTTIYIDFSRYLDSTAAVTVENFIIDKSIGNPAGVQWGVDNDVSKVLLTTSSLTPGTTYSLQVKNLKSINNVLMNDTTVSFQASGTTGAVSVAIAPASFILHQNFPNPFNPTTEIRFQIPEVKGQRSEVSQVILKVYDVLGRETATLVDKVIEAGEYSVSFNSLSLPSGIYFYRLTAGGNSIVKKMILQK
ncbi:MAG: endonuclease [Ignavibacteriales bacterium]|nr:endonuclease [Ignavibacteriales bacterium]